jgi:tetratricopeptide (TPR) repeat protein
VFAVQLRVGSTVGMVGGPLGDSRATAFWTMGEVWLRYLKALVFPPSLSIVYDPSPVVVATFASVVGWLLMAGSVGYGLWRAISGKTCALGVVVWAWLPLLPVSQVVFPLQNVQADRYLWLTSVALGLVLGVAWRANNAGKGLTAALVTIFAVGTAHRAALFGDAVALFADASDKSTGPRAPYQLGYALQQQGETSAAIEAYRAALARPCDDCSPQSSAANNLATLFVAQNEPHLAEPVLRRNLTRFPEEPKSLFNLVKVLTRLGRVEEARRLYDEGKLRFPDYDVRAGLQTIGGR